jgi:hypothetical protein
MTTSGTFTTIAGLDISVVIDEAFRRLSLAPESLTSDTLISARLSLDLLMIELINKRDFQFTTDQQTKTLTTGVGSFITSDGTIDVLEMVFRQNGQDIQMQPLSRRDYLFINDKTVQGEPISYFVDKTNLPPTVYLWPVPNIADTQVVYNRKRQMYDVGDLTNTPDSTIIFRETLIAGLAYKLAEKYAPERLSEKKDLYEESLMNASKNERDRSPLVLRPRVGQRLGNGT